MKGFVFMLLILVSESAAGQAVTITFAVGSELGTEMTAVTAERVTTTNGPFNCKDITKMRFTAGLPDSASIHLLQSNGIEVYDKSRRVAPIVAAETVKQPDPVVLDSAQLIAADSTNWAMLESRAKEDSVEATRIRFSHYYSQEQGSSTNFIRTFDDRNSLLPSNGISILNVIRARVPNLAMSTSVYQPTGALRAISGYASEAGYLVDGVPFDSKLVQTNSLNLNTFEFASISTVSSANGMVLFDLPGGGAFLLRSRNGAGYSKPSFEFNGNFTSAWSDASFSGTEAKWLTSYSLAYMQDFGVVDMRVSYNLATGPPLSTGESPFYHAFKINTGFEFHPRLSIRAIFDGRFMAETSDLGPGNYFTKSESFLQGNLTATYRAFDWLDFSMQWVLSQRDSTAEERFGSSGRGWDRSDNRNLWNAFGKFKRKLGEQFYITGLAGVQLSGVAEVLTTKLFIDPNQYHKDRKASIGSQNGMAGVDVFYRKLLNASFQFREILYDSVRSGSRSRATFSTGLAFNFSELLQWKRLNLGRLRASYGEGNPTRFASYPHTTLFLPTDSRLVRNLEIGMDVGLPNSPVALSVNYFSARSNSAATFEAGGYGVTLFEQSIDDGWEVLMNLNPKVTERFRNRSTLVFSTFRALRLPGPSSPYQVVRTGLYNESKWRGFLLSFLLEHYTVSGSQSASSLRIRDLTVGFDTSPNLTQPGRLSIFITGRNFADFFTKDDDERIVPLNKSISFGFTVII